MTDKITACSFCGKDNNEVTHLIAGPSCFICNECISLCTEIIANHEATKKETPVSNVFEDKPDARQSDDVNMPTSRFRKRYRALTEDEVAKHDAIKAKAEELESLIESLPPGRYRSLAITELEKCIMWAVKELTS
jgi:hypothetical protein